MINAQTSSAEGYIQSFFQVVLFSSASNPSKVNAKREKGMGRLETRMADILHTHRSCKVAKWKDHAMQ
jgi:hypothetical protein